MYSNLNSTQNIEGSEGTYRSKDKKSRIFITSSAPRLFTNSRFFAPAVPTTYSPRFLANCTAITPTLLDADRIKRRCPDFGLMALSDCHAVSVTTGAPAISSKATPSGTRAMVSSLRATYSA